MTAHPIDTEALAKRAGHILFTAGPEQPAATAREVCVLLDLLAAAEARIKAVRELHSESRIIPGTPVFGCAECGEPNETEPCATIRALEG